MSKKLQKGERTEEILRQYFLNLGYFAVRNLHYKYKQFEVTDIDIWLYSRPSPLTRERANVDIKRKRTPQALERIFWAKGLQNALSLELCIVATTDTRPDVRDFGALNNVVVLDGDFLQRLEKSGKIQNDRITEEDLLFLLSKASLGKLGGDWKGRYHESKSRLLNRLNFDGCNEWLAEIKYFMEQIITSAPQEAAAIRVLYVIISFFLIAVDYAIHRYVSLESNTRLKILSDGFRYGQMGRARSIDITNLAMNLLESISPDATSTSRGFREEIQKQLDEIPAEILAEYFSKSQNMKELFSLAREFEKYAYVERLIDPGNLPTNLQGIIGLFCDFFQIDRKKVLSTNSEPTARTEKENEISNPNNSFT